MAGSVHQQHRLARRLGAQINGVGRIEFGEIVVQPRGARSVLGKRRRGVSREDCQQSEKSGQGFHGVLPRVVNR